MQTLGLKFDVCTEGGEREGGKAGSEVAESFTYHSPVSVRGHIDTGGDNIHS